MMKWLFPLVLLVACRCAAETVAQLRQIEPELGAALGFQIYQFESRLGTDEVLVVHQCEEDTKGRNLEIEHALVGNQTLVTYRIVLVDSGAFHPSLRGAYQLRLPGGERCLEKTRLLSWGHSVKPPLEVDLRFAEALGNTPTLRFRWWVTVESYASAAQRWPNLPKPSALGCSSSSSRLVEK